MNVCIYIIVSTINKLSYHIISYHIIISVNSKVWFPCGFCGRDSYSCALVYTGNKKKGQKYFKAFSNLPYFVDLLKEPVKSSVRNPCTNYIFECILCKSHIWKYNMICHYQDMQSNTEISKQHVIDLTNFQFVTNLAAGHG